MGAGLTSHVLDTARGGPAHGIRLDLYSLDNNTKTHLLTTHTNEGGRTDKPLLDAEAIKAGKYQIDFHVGDFFENSDIATSNPKYLDIVPVEFGIADTNGHYHVPLLASPWSFSNYRGSSPTNMPDDNLPDTRTAEQKENFRYKTYDAITPETPPAAPGTDNAGVTTHVIDMIKGCGVNKIKIDIFKLDGNERTHVKSVYTNNEGRSEEWLINAGEIEAANYEFAFHVGDYFANNGVKLPEVRYLDIVPLALGFSPDQGHYHIPLLLAPWGYSTYRGS